MSKSPSPRLDPFVFCLRNSMDPNNPDNKDLGRHASVKKYVKVPKAETAGLRDEIISHLKTTAGKMKVGEFVDLVAKYYNLFLKRQSMVKRGGIKAGAKLTGVDPNTGDGRKWWVNGCGGDEDSYFIQEWAPVFTPSGDERDYFEDLLMCLVKETPQHAPASLKKKKRKKSKKKSKKKKLSKKLKKLSKKLKKLSKRKKK
jgi:hypothetical protein